MIRFHDVSHRYHSGLDALNHVTFEIPRGEGVFLTGHSGAGKSTILDLIAKMKVPTKGEVFVNNINLNEIRASQLPYFRRQIGLIFQNAKLIPNATVFENIAIPLKIIGTAQEEMRRRVRASLDKVGLIGKDQALPCDLSAGEQQRVSIARAIITRPPLLLADEPTGNLDPFLSKEIMQLFQELNAMGMTVLIATHDVALTKHFPFRTITLRHGQIRQDSTEKEVA
jgi:cell division transport system ATP-binding protein